MHAYEKLLSSCGGWEGGGGEQFLTIFDTAFVAMAIQLKRNHSIVTSYLDSLVCRLREFCPVIPYLKE